MSVSKLLKSMIRMETNIQYDTDHGHFSYEYLCFVQLAIGVSACISWCTVDGIY